MSSPCRAHVDNDGPPVASACRWSPVSGQMEPATQMAATIPIRRAIRRLLFLYSGACACWDASGDGSTKRSSMFCWSHCRVPRGLGGGRDPKRGCSQDDLWRPWLRFQSHILPWSDRTLFADLPACFKPSTMPPATQLAHSSAARPAPVKLTESGRWQQGHELCGFLPSRSLFGQWGFCIEFFSLHHQLCGDKWKALSFPNFSNSVPFLVVRECHALQEASMRLTPPIWKEWKEKHSFHDQTD